MQTLQRTHDPRVRGADPLSSPVMSSRYTGNRPGRHRSTGQHHQTRRLARVGVAGPRPARARRRDPDVMQEHGGVVLSAFVSHFWHTAPQKTVVIHNKP